LADPTDGLLGDVLDAVTKRGRRAIALLGFSDLSCIVYGRLEDIGLADHVVGVFDPRRERHGGRLGLHEVAQIEAATTVDVDLLVVCADEEKEELLRAYAAVDGRLPEVVLAGVGHFDFADPVFTALTGKVLVKSTATGSPHTLVHLYQCLRAAARLGLAGAIAEFGIYKGGTTVMLAKMARALGVDGPVIGFDSFAGFPPRRSLFDLYADPVCEYTDVDDVRRYCEPYGVEIIAGDIVETYHRLEEEPLVLSFFDTDNYTPTKAALPLCMEQTVGGGSIVFDHFHSLDEFRYTLGERMAAAELLLDSDFFHLHGTGVFTRLR
jgi:O-methyltransferase